MSFIRELSGLPLGTDYGAPLIVFKLTSMRQKLCFYEPVTFCNLGNI